MVTKRNMMLLEVIRSEASYRRWYNHRMVTQRAAFERYTQYRNIEEGSNGVIIDAWIIIEMEVLK